MVETIAFDLCEHCDLGAYVNQQRHNVNLKLPPDVKEVGQYICPHCAGTEKVFVIRKEITDETTPGRPWDDSDTGDAGYRPHG
jgi:hypothetical protein